MKLKVIQWVWEVAAKIPVCDTLKKILPIKSVMQRTTYSPLAEFERTAVYYWVKYIHHPSAWFLLLWGQGSQNSEVIFMIQKRCESLLTIWLCVGVCISRWVILPTRQCPYIRLPVMQFCSSRIRTDCWHYGSKDIVGSNLATLVGVVTLALCLRARTGEGMLDTNQWEK